MLANGGEAFAKTTPQQLGSPLAERAARRSANLLQSCTGRARSGWPRSATCLSRSSKWRLSAPVGTPSFNAAENIVWLPVLGGHGERRDLPSQLPAPASSSC